MKNPYLNGILVASLFSVLLFGGWQFFRSHYGTQELDGVNASLLDIMEKKGPPVFSAKSLNGNLVSLSKFKGKKVIVNFWATWCAPCVDEFPSMVELAEKMGEELVILAISADENREDINSFLNAFKEASSNLIVIQDSTRQIAESFGTKKLPESFILGKDLKLKRKVASSVNWMDPNVIEFLRAL